MVLRGVSVVGPMGLFRSLERTEILQTSAETTVRVLRADRGTLRDARWRGYKLRFACPARIVETHLSNRGHIRGGWPALKFLGSQSSTPFPGECTSSEDRVGHLHLRFWPTISAWNSCSSTTHGRSGPPFARSCAVIERKCTPCVLQPPKRGQGNREHGNLSIEMPRVDCANKLVG